MLKLMICGVGLAALGGAATSAEAAASGRAKTTCDAKYYDYLVGKSVEEARSVNSDYRVLPRGSARGQAEPKRMTIVYDARSREIIEVACG